MFDVNMNEILPISAESFLFLKMCMSGEADVTSSEITEIQELCQAGYLKTESVVHKIQHPYTQYLKYFLDRKLPKITLQVTQGCNLRCKYCIYSETNNKHQRSHSNKHMSWETAKRSVDFLHEHSIDSDKVNIGFYGGEPLLEFPLIQKVIAYAHNVFEGKQVTFAITTNGTLLNETIIKYFEKENVRLLISLDGPKAIHDKSRVFSDGRGSFDTVMQNFAKLKEIAPDYAKQVNFSMVMDPTNDFDCINEITFSSDDINQHAFLATIVEIEEAQEQTFSEEYIWKVEYQMFLAFFASISRFPKNRVSVATQGAVGSLMLSVKYFRASAPLNAVDVPSGPCVPGQQRLFVSVDGKFFPCERVSENSDATCIGSLDDGFDIEKANRILNIGSITANTCRECWSLRYCSLCAKRADDGSPNLSIKKKMSHCKKVHADTYTKMRQYIMFQELGLYYADQTKEIGGNSNE